MIVFDLKCASHHVFEAWFRDGATYEAQAAAGEVTCPLCGDTDIAKAPMAPKVARGSGSQDNPEFAKAAKAMAWMRAVHDHVEKNFDDVGRKFPEEARKIHHGETEKRNIRGEASADDARELKDEGIEFGVLPRLPRQDS